MTASPLSPHKKPHHHSELLQQDTVTLSSTDNTEETVAPTPTNPTSSTTTAYSSSNAIPDPLPVTGPPSSSEQIDYVPSLRKSSTPSSRTSELARLRMTLSNSLRQFPDFPTKGILFEDILPVFANAQTHRDLLTALELHVLDNIKSKPDIVVGLEARGFLFGPSLALQLGAGFVPVRKVGKVPGPLIKARYEKEYGEDWFEMQADGIKRGQKVLIVDDIIATGE